METIDEVCLANTKCIEFVVDKNKNEVWEVHNEHL